LKTWNISRRWRASIIPKKNLEALLATAGLQSQAFDQRLAGYSKGMRQKVGIAIAVAKKAKVLLLDEPTSGLDPKASNEIFGIPSKTCGERYRYPYGYPRHFQGPKKSRHVWYHERRKPGIGDPSQVIFRPMSWKHCI
jgi:ABC-type histidine transport system ATPase subunit